MKSFNLIVVFTPDREKLLFCKRRKDPYQGLSNFVGGKVEPGEGPVSAAYRELWEETGITRADIALAHLADFTYYVSGCQLQVYVGRLKREVPVAGEENELYWSDLDHDFFDTSQYAGIGNIGHILLEVREAWDKLPW